MRSAAAGAGRVLLAALVVAGALLATLQAGAPRSPLAQTGGSGSGSSSGSSSGGSSGNGSSGSSGNGSSGTSNGSSGNGSSGTSGDGSSGTSGDGSSGTSGSGGDRGGGGTPSPTTAAPGPGGRPSPSTTAPRAIPSPSTATSVPPDKVADGRQVDCGPGVPIGTRCFDVGAVRGIEAVRVPDGLGGFVIVPIVAVPVVDVDTGASTSAASNVDLRIGVNERTGEVVRVERRTEPVHQRVLVTLGVLLLVVSTSFSTATWIRLRRLERGPDR